MGKTALLDYVADQASGFTVLRGGGVESEMELAFAGLHQLLAPMPDRLDGLPVPQADALRTAFGVTLAPAPDRFLVGLAVLGLLSEMAEERPLVCLVDGEQWLDRASVQALAFVARRLSMESVGLVFATRVVDEDLAGVPELVLAGLEEADAHALLDSVLAGPLDARIRDRIVSETRGNPLALLELPRGATPDELAGGFGLPGAVSLSGRIEERFQRRLDALPEETRRLLLLAAADPVGDPGLVWSAAGRLEIPASAVTPALESGLVEFGTRVRFRHPLARSAVYQAASLPERQDVHRALAQATDPELDPDRRAWHLAQATAGTDEEMASALEQSAGRAQARGGLAAAAAFLERAATLTPEPAHRGRRLLAAAQAKRDAGALDAALALLALVEAGPLDERRDAEAEHLRGQIAFDQRRGAEAVPMLLTAATRLEPIDGDLARETYLEVLLAGMWVGHLGDPSNTLTTAAHAARRVPRGPRLAPAVDALVDGFAIRLTDGYEAAAPTLTSAVELLFALDVSSEEARRWLWRVGARASGVVPLELWDFESLHTLATRQVEVARYMGALVHLQFALTFLVVPQILGGEITAAVRLVEEDRMIARATGNPPVAHTAMLLAAWQGDEAAAAGLIATIAADATELGLGRLVNSADYARSVLYNGLGQHEIACEAARRAFEREVIGHGPLVVVELVEAASRTGHTELLESALEWLSERSRATPSDWALGIEARIHALLSQGDAADRFYRESIDRLGRSRVRVELARAHLIYGEWLRRERRRVDARDQLRAAHEMFDAMRLNGFAERARRELLATGETARKRTIETRDDLTPQEALIARMARDGLSNPEIATRLFISPRTVKYHLRKVFTKLDIGSRVELAAALPDETEVAQPA